MDADSPNWRPVGDPVTASEAAALEALRRLLPDTGAIAWTNLYFVDLQGNASEVDAIVLSTEGLFIVELKGWHGTFTGNQFFWTIDQNGRRRERKSPLELTDLKGKRMKSLLEDERRRGNFHGPHLPYFQPIIVMHGEDSKFRLTGPAAAHLYGLDGYRVKGLRPVSALFDGKTPDNRLLDAATYAATAQLFGLAGLKARPKVRTIGQYRLEDVDPVAVGPGWEDFSVVQPGLAKHRRRVRVFPIPPRASIQDRTRIERTARREYLLTYELSHPGIVSAKDFIDEPPAVVFLLEPDAQPLDRWLDEHASGLTLDDRLRLIREIAEALQHAHRHGVHHRALSPAAVYVRDTAGGGWHLSIRDWQTGTQVVDPDVPGDTSLQGATSVPDLTDQQQWVYLAPEAYTVKSPDGSAMDVYGLGALAYLILTGNAPAANLAELQERIGSDGLDVSSDTDGLPGDLVALVSLATKPAVSDRLASVDEFTDELTMIEARPGEQPEQSGTVVDPLDATTLDVLVDADGREWLVERRLGTGSSGRALLVSDETPGSRPVVLKIAVDEEKAQRLVDEAEVLKSLDHPLVVKVLGDPFTLHGRTCVLMENAGDPTLGKSIREDGRLTFERLQTFGNDLLEITAYLASRGVNHRDIKPDNFATRPDPSTRRPRLIIFDFSLSREKITNLRSGTQPYLDPFLGVARGRATYDSAAERFSAAVTLFEMATGHIPVWGDGQSSPEVIDDEVNVAAEMFEGPHPEQMVAFFQRALARNAKDRFGDVAEMGQAWQRLFTTSATTVKGRDVTDADRDEAAAHVSEATSLVDAGFTSQALSAARRLGAETVSDVLGLDPILINQQAGIGLHTRREIQRRRKQWLEALRKQTWVEDSPAAGRSVEDLQGALVPRSNGVNRAAVDLATAVVAEPGWPTVAALAAAADVAPADLSAATAQLGKFWSRSNSRLNEVAQEVVSTLQASENIATLSEISAVLVARHGSQIIGTPERLAAAVPLVRAVVEAQEGLLDDAEILLNRDTADGPLLLGLQTGDDTDMTATLATVRKLGADVDSLTGGVDVLATPNDAVALVAPAAQDLSLPVPRLVRLAAACSASSDVSTRGELYRIGLPATVTVPRVLHGGGNAAVSVKTLQERVAKRYPNAAPLPDRPALDALVHDAVPGLKWDGSNYTRSVSGSMLTGGTKSTAIFTASDAELDNARRKLANSLTARTGLVVAVDPRHLGQAATALVREFDVVEINIGRELIDAAKQIAARAGIDWQFLLRVDGTATASDRSNLNRLMGQALDSFWEQILQSEQPILFTDAAVLARYSLTERLAPLTNLATPLPAARWILVPHRGKDAAPTLDGTAVPLGADGWLDLPPAMIATRMPKGA